MPISPTKTRIILTIDKDLLAWVDARARLENRDRNNWIVTQILKVKDNGPRPTGEKGE